MASVHRRCTTKGCRSAVPPAARSCPSCRSRTFSYFIRYRNPEGRQQTESKPTREEAKARVRELERDLRAGTWRDPEAGRTPFGTWAQSWLATKVHLTPASQISLEGIVRNHLARWSERPIGGIQRADVQALVAELATTKAPATVRKVYAAAGAIFRDAVVEGMIPASPCVRVDLPRLVERPRRFHTAEQVHALADAIDPRYRALVLLAGYGGLRPSELVGLRVAHLDLLRRRITVAEGIVEAGGKVHPSGPTKTGAVTTYTLPAFVVDELAAHLHAYPPGADGLVFPAPKGGPIRWSSWRARYFAPAVDAAGIGPTTPYALRHSAVSLMAASGASLHEAGRRVGHRSVVTTNRYAHLFDERDVEIAEGLDRIARQAAEGAVRARDARPLRVPSGDGSVSKLPTRP